MERECAQVSSCSSRSDGAMNDNEATEILLQLVDEVAQLRAELSCTRCKTPPPPPERWAGDPWSRDSRPPHSCGKTGRAT
jgi:hypothetical protein